MTTQEATAVHIAQADSTTITVGDHIEQAGITYRVTAIEGTRTASGFRPDVIYLAWTGSEESDIYRSVINTRGAVGQIRWEGPHGMAVWFNGRKVAA